MWPLMTSRMTLKTSLTAQNHNFPRKSRKIVKNHDFLMIFGQNLALTSILTPHDQIWPWTTPPDHLLTDAFFGLPWEPTRPPKPLQKPTAPPKPPKLSLSNYSDPLHTPPLKT